MGYAAKRRDSASLATLAAMAILASLLCFHWFGPFSSSSWSSLFCENGCVASANPDGPAAPVISSSKSEEKEAGRVPYVAAKAVAVVDDECGELIFGEDAHRRLPPASLTKLAAALVTLETAAADETVDVDVDGIYFGDSTVMGLETGMRLSLRDLLYGLLLPSGNDAAVAIARHVAGDVPTFVSRMNAKARALGLQDTHFTNPHGLDSPGHYSSAYDMALLARAAMKDPLLAEIVRTKVWQPAWDGPQLWNGNLLLWLYPESDGVKIGWTENAGQTIVASAQRDGRGIFVALLGSDDRYTDAIRLLDWAFDESEWSKSSGGCSASGG